MDDDEQHNFSDEFWYTVHPNDLPLPTEVGLGEWDETTPVILEPLPVSEATRNLRASKYSEICYFCAYKMNPLDDGQRRPHLLGVLRSPPEAAMNL